MAKPVKSRTGRAGSGLVLRAAAGQRSWAGAEAMVRVRPRAGNARDRARDGAGRGDQSWGTVTKSMSRSTAPSRSDSMSR
jgi:hypothetical protein